MIRILEEKKRETEFINETGDQSKVIPASLL